MQNFVSDNISTSQLNFQLALGSAITWQVEFSPLGVGYMIANELKLQAGYQRTTLVTTENTLRTNRQASFTKTASIHLSFEGIDPQYSYWVTPFAVSFFRVGCYLTIVTYIYPPHSTMQQM